MLMLHSAAYRTMMPDHSVSSCYQRCLWCQRRLHPHRFPVRCHQRAPRQRRKSGSLPRPVVLKERGHDISNWSVPVSITNGGSLPLLMVAPWTPIAGRPVGWYPPSWSPSEEISGGIGVVVWCTGCKEDQANDATPKFSVERGKHSPKILPDPNPSRDYAAHPAVNRSVGRHAVGRVFEWGRTYVSINGRVNAGATRRSYIGVQQCTRVRCSRAQCPHNLNKLNTVMWGLAQPILNEATLVQNIRLGEGML